MKIYELQIPEANSGKAAREAVEIAFEDGTDLIMEGVKEGLPVELAATVSFLGRIRQEGAFLVRFSGVINPESQPYVANFSESEEDSPFIDITVGEIE